MSNVQNTIDYTKDQQEVLDYLNTLGHGAWEWHDTGGNLNAFVLPLGDNKFYSIADEGCEAPRNLKDKVSLQHYYEDENVEYSFELYSLTEYNNLHELLKDLSVKNEF